MTRCEADHSGFFLYSSTGLHIFIVVYVDGIVIIGYDVNGIHRLKTSGYYILIRGNMISWRSKKQNTVALSSAKAE